VRIEVRNQRRTATLQLESNWGRVADIFIEGRGLKHELIRRGLMLLVNAAIQISFKHLRGNQ
jgi:hypothetical protein